METLKRSSIVVLLIAVAAAGCGTSHSSGTATTSPTPGASASTPANTATAANTPTTASSPTDCTTLGIDPSGMREGTCTHAGVTWVIVDETHTLRLSTLAAKLAGINASKTAASGGSAGTGPGKLVTATLTITNRLAAPQAFDQAHTQQAGLILSGAVFKEDVGAENSADANSCLKHNGPPLQPGKAETCDVIFDVPASVAADLGKHGSGDLYLVNFGSDLSGSVVPQTIGQIRLYH